MDNVPFGSDDSTAPWNEKDSQTTRCEICGWPIFLDDTSYVRIEVSLMNVYICENCLTKIDHERS